MDDLAYLVNQVQQREPPIMHAHARFAEEEHLREPTVHIFNTDTSELIWRLPLTDLVQLAAHFFRLNPDLMLAERGARGRVPGVGDAGTQYPTPETSQMNDLAYLANQVRSGGRGPQARGRVQRAQAELIGDGEEPTVLLVDSATNDVLLGLPLDDLLRLAHHLRLDTGLVFQGQG